MNLTARAPERLDRFLARELPAYSRGKLAAIIAEGAVSVDGVVRKPAFLLDEGMVVTIDRLPISAPHDLTPHDIPLRILHEDEHLLVVDKPRGLATHPSPTLREPTLVNALLHRGQALSSAGGAYRPGIVHRLDKETTGLLVVAKSDSVHERLAVQLRSKEAERRYLARLVGRPRDERFLVEAPITRDPRSRQRMAVVARGRHAVTHFKVVRDLDPGVLAVARLETGRTHQIRVHATFAGHPVVGDPVYGRAPHDVRPMQLHAALLSFVHPEKETRMTFVAELPADFLGAEERDLSSLEPW